jgi:sulfur carrier protein ThiS
MVRLVLREHVYEVKAGMTLIAALEKANILPGTVIAVRNDEMILEDEILRDGDEVKLVAVISGG